MSRDNKRTIENNEGEPKTKSPNNSNNNSPNGSRTNNGESSSVEKSPQSTSETRDAADIDGMVDLTSPPGKYENPFFSGSSDRDMFSVAPMVDPTSPPNIPSNPFFSGSGSSNRNMSSANRTSYLSDQMDMIRSFNSRRSYATPEENVEKLRSDLKKAQESIERNERLIEKYVSKCSTLEKELRDLKQSRTSDREEKGTQADYNESEEIISLRLQLEKARERSEKDEKIKDNQVALYSRLKAQYEILEQKLEYEKKMNSYGQNAEENIKLRQEMQKLKIENDSLRRNVEHLSSVNRYLSAQLEAKQQTSMFQNNISSFGSQQDHAMSSSRSQQPTRRTLDYRSQQRNYGDTYHPTSDSRGLRSHQQNVMDSSSSSHQPYSRDAVDHRLQQSRPHQVRDLSHSYQTEYLRRDPLSDRRLDATQTFNSSSSSAFRQQDVMDSSSSRVSHQPYSRDSVRQQQIRSAEDFQDRALSSQDRTAQWANEQTNQFGQNINPQTTDSSSSQTGDQGETPANSVETRNTENDNIYRILENATDIYQEEL